MEAMDSVMTMVFSVESAVAGSPARNGQVKISKMLSSAKNPLSSYLLSCSVLKNNGPGDHATGDRRPASSTSGRFARSAGANSPDVVANR